MSPRRVSHPSLPLLCLLLVGACSSSAGGLDGGSDTGSESGTGTGTETDAPAKYQATIRRTAHGVAHILAADIGSAGFGQAYAFAQDHACVLADQILKVRSERAKFLGRGPADRHVNSDFAYLSLDVVARAEAALAVQSEEVGALIDGYVAGYNQYLADTGVDQVPGSCKGQPWLRPISATDLFAYYVDLALLASGNALVNYIATAQPPGAPLVLPGGPLSGLRSRRAEGLGSNGWALGKARSASGAGLVVANPHFPWEGELKLWESHVTVPGLINVYGVALMGVPGALIGFNDHIGWTHTFSAGQRFNIYSLDLVEGDPTQYLYDGEPRKMTSRDFTIEVQQADGALKTEARKLYYSHYGPILNVDPFGWSPSVALTYRDANIDNQKLIAQFLGMNKARSMAEFKQVYADIGGIPWVNTMAADATGQAWYIDASATPRLEQPAIEGWLEAINGGDFLAGALYQQGVVALDGSSSVNEWSDAAGARSPGVVPYAELPQIDRDDFVFNANDSYWLSNPAAPLVGFSPLHGFERVPQSPRTRMNMRLLTEVVPNGASGADGKFTVEELKGAIMGDRSFTAELLRDEVVARCQAVSTVEEGGVTVDLKEACAALAAWDGRFAPDSAGAGLWREFLGAFGSAALEDRSVLLDVPFDPDQPLETPNTLALPPMGEPDKVMAGLARAQSRLKEAGFALDAPLKVMQQTTRGAQKFSIPGGQSRDGTANVVTYNILKSTVEPSAPRGPLINAETGLTAEGYVINFGSSFVMALEIGEDGPRGQAFLSYSQSDDPASPYFSDQTALFEAKQWRPLVFSEADIAADTALKTLEVAGGE